MVKKIATLVLSVSVIVVGIMALNRLNYWERSVWILKVDNQQNFGRRDIDRSRPNFEGRNNREGKARFEHPDTQILPDGAIQQRAENFRRDRESSNRERNFDRDRHDRGSSRRGRNVQLGNVSWFLAASALFTVVTIYIDKVFCTLRRKRKNTSS